MTAAISAEARQVERLVAEAESIFILTGAGMSQESGVPTFRDAQTGLWAQFDPMELATEDAFRRHPARVFGWYVWRFQLVSRVEPHAGHRALVHLQHEFFDSGAESGEAFMLVTQNVDGLHQRAGSTNVIELHGSLGRFRCLDQGHPFDVAGLADLAVPDDGEVTPPACAECGSPVRPGVVWFGEQLPVPRLERAYDGARRCDLMIVVGTSGIVYPAAGLPEIAIRRGTPVIEIGPQPTPLTAHATLSWASTAAGALTQLQEAMGLS